jgi:hypothetical protein
MLQQKAKPLPIIGCFKHLPNTREPLAPCPAKRSRRLGWTRLAKWLPWTEGCFAPCLQDRYPGCQPPRRFEEVSRPFTSVAKKSTFRRIKVERAAAARDCENFGRQQMGK